VTHLVGELAAVIATALFIFALYWMNDPKTARHAVVAGVTGMTVAVLATWIQPEIVHHGWIFVAIVAGFAVGIPLSRVPLTAVPQRTACRTRSAVLPPASSAPRNTSCGSGSTRRSSRRSGRAPSSPR